MIMIDNSHGSKTLVVSIQGWELEVLDGPYKMNMDLLGEMLEFRGIWLTEPERGIVNVFCHPDKIFYLEVTTAEAPVKRPGRRNKVTPLRCIDTPPNNNP